ncbi:PREDICTED: serine/threonine-protein kinase Nek4-like [Acropora digitifera]|uniref:serine/threonine-protein kinase Nek4-like n=1 Tax=Acropora digitifera TaxID=70779 RepID=UPI00077B2368|nr:PREDICTED: serine/threonine-protein kinase Nek4-like [Acropora digitifera]
MSLDRYKIDKVIGKGSYGEVSLVKHKKDKKQYVMKKVDLSKASDKERKAAEQEAKLLSQLRHPNIVSYRESFQDDQGFLYIVMNFCEGGDLYTKLKSQVKECQMLKETQVVEWFVQITMALQYMHERHVLHRDLKTQNIFLTKSNIIKVGDLGIARVLESASDMASTLIGTPYYMSPELFTNKPYNHKSDVWALGCCVYEMCTLQHAFNAKDMSSLVYKILKGKFPPLPSNYSPDLCSIVHSMLEQDPQKRPSAQRLLRHNYIKKQIALFLEGTKNRQKKKTGSKERIPSAKSRETQSQSSKSDSGNSGSGLEGSIATASAIDCIIEEEKLPKQARNNKERSFTDSSSSSSGYSEKGQTEVNVEKSKGKNAIELKQREMIKKQLSERKRSASEKSSNASVSKQKVAEKLVEDIEEKRPLPVVAKARTPRAEESARPLPRPPKGNSLAEDLPPSRSPRVRRRYKVSSSCLAARSQYAEDEEEEDDINSEARC